MTFTAGNVTALFYPAGSWHNRETVVKFGRWKARSGGFLLSDYFSVEDLEDLLDVAVQTHEYFVHHGRKARGRKV